MRVMPKTGGSIRSHLGDLVVSLWQASAALTAVGLLMVIVTMASALGLIVDERVITGAPAWLKPLKFAVSTAIYSGTLAWIFRSLTEWPRMRRVVGWTTAVVFLLEVAIIAAQAWRGTTSHFNVSTPANALLFFVMGGAILLQTLVSICVAVALWRQRFEDEALGWALRAGMIMTIVGALTGGLMTRPTPAQLAHARAGEHLTVVGAHTVGAPDGGAGIPVTGWSRDHGDLRVPHFVGLHAVQALAIVVFALKRWRRPERVHVRTIIAVAVSYAALFVVLLIGALRGQSLIAPDAPMVVAVLLWTAVTAGALGWIVFGGATTSRRALNGAVV